MQKILFRTDNNFDVRVSVVIVGYNAKFFLEQCLLSVEKALRLAGEALQQEGFAADIWVIDNNSVDGAVEYLRPRFPLVHFISNTENTGFARASNQGYRASAGEFVLFLNPDTLLPEDFFTRTLVFLQAHPQAGALGVYMMDGSGRYLKESKRGFPGAWASFCKMTGLTALFPRSRWLASYYLGQLDPSITQPVDSLSGACLLARRTALDQTGGFDEQFFMYGEDLDLSYRIRQAGYTNYYFPETPIIHFKGESTPRDPAYVKRFYKAMSQFVAKHYRGRFSALAGGCLQAAIVIRALVAGITQPFQKLRHRSEKRITPFYLLGDSGCRARLRELLGEAVANGPGRAGSVVFCEGPGFSFAEIIRSLPGTGRVKLIHASGSGSLVGSISGEKKGITVTLPNTNPG